MTLKPNQLHDAFEHALNAADLDATAPSELGEPVARPLELDLSRRRSHLVHRRPALVAAVVIAVAGLAVGGALVASRPTGNDTQLSLAAPTGPVVAAALDAPDLTLIDSFDEEELGAPHTSGEVPRAHLAIFETPAGATLAVADRSENGDGSIDRFAGILDVPWSVVGVEVRSRSDEAVDLTSGLDASTWVVDDRHITVASRGLTPAQHDAEVELLVSASMAGKLRDVSPAGFVLQYAGPDENPLYFGGPTTSVAAYSADDGDVVRVIRQDAKIDAEHLARYAWYRTDADPTEINGRPTLRIEDADGKASLVVATDDGFVVIHSQRGDVERYADAVVLLDAPAWADLQATATQPGSIYSSIDATTVPQ